jgi:predicted N-acetyltransferase YhbS
MTSQSFCLRPIRNSDFAEAIALTETVDWGLCEEDFRLMSLLEPQGSFVAVSGGHVVGLITSVSYGHLGWIGNVIVEPSRRREGIGRALVEKALEHLERRHVTTVGLYAYHEVIGFYEQLGFVGDRDFVWLVCTEADWTGVPVEPFLPEGFDDLLRLDEDLFGASRRRLLKLLYEGSPSLCRGVFEGGRLVAYVMGSSGELVEVGPWAAVTGYEEEGLGLFRSLADEVRGREVLVGVPAWKRGVINFLTSIGFERRFAVTRMYRGPPVPEKDCVLGIESLERG